jgi:hypothetical protein
MTMCSKQGCGAERITGHPCNDFDCPQRWVSADKFREIESENAKLRAAIPRGTGRDCPCGELPSLQLTRETRLRVPGLQIQPTLRNESMRTRPITKDHVGKRVLLTDRLTGSSRMEAEVLELSPSAENVKLRNLDAGTTFWQEIDEDEVLEVLPKT